MTSRVESMGNINAGAVLEHHFAAPHPSWYSTDARRFNPMIITRIDDHLTHGFIPN
jgi:hypothetical protein